MTQLLITGSRNISNRGILYAQALVQRAWDLDWHIIVGDASGIDSTVIKYSWRLASEYGKEKAENFIEVHGAYSKLRRKGPGDNYVHSGDYLSRDRIMVAKLQPRDWAIAVWNGESPGTRYTIWKAEDVPGVTTWIKEFKNE
jgi:hypothetical protein